MAWIFVANLKGPKGDIGSWDGGGLPAGSDLNTFFGGTASPNRLASYTVALDSTAATILNAPPGARAGTFDVRSIGSTAAVLTWKNHADGRSWNWGIFANPASNTPFFEDRKRGTKRVGEPLTVAGSAMFDTNTNVGVRLPLRVPVTPKRWRVYIRNQNDRTATAYPGALSFTGVSIGKGAVDSNGRPTGQFDGGKAPISAAFTSSESGAQWVSPWMDYVLEPGQPYILSYGYTSAAQNNHASVGGGWTTNLGSGAINTDGTALTATKNAPLDVWIAYEVDDDTPHYAYFGDSLTAGVSADLPVYDSWAKRHALANGAFAQMYAYSGTAYTEWTSAQKFGLNKYTGFSGVAKPDRLYNAMGSNDLGSASIATMRTRFNTTVPLLKSFTSPNMFLVTILPRLVGDDTFEVNRKAWNEILRTELPGDALACLEAAAALEAPSGSVLDPRWPASPTDIHLNRAGYARYAAAMTSMESASKRLSVANVAALPAAAVNEGVTYYVGSEKLPYFSNGTTWQPINSGSKGDPGPPGAGVPAGGAAKQVVRRNAANTTTEWGTLVPADVGLSNVDNTSDAAKPISEQQSVALAGKASRAELDTKADAAALGTKADLLGGKILETQIPIGSIVSDANIAPIVAGPLTSVAIDARVNAQVAPQVQQITSDFIAADAAVVQAAAAAVDANPKISTIDSALGAAGIVSDLVTNGSFRNGLTGWGNVGAWATANNGVTSWARTTSGADAAMTQSIVVPAFFRGKTMRLYVRAMTTSAGTLQTRVTTAAGNTELQHALTTSYALKVLDVAIPANQGNTPIVLNVGRYSGTVYMSAIRFEVL